MTVLDSASRSDGESLEGAVAQVVGRYPQIAELVFTPVAAPHPLSDAAEVFHHAAGQLLKSGTERPLAFFGYHSMNRFTRSREAVGLLLTDRAVHVKDSPAGLFGEKVPRVVPLLAGRDGPAASAAAAVASATSDFDWKSADRVITVERRPLLLQAVTDAIVVVLGRAAVSAALPTEVPRATGLLERADELGLGAVLKLPDERTRKHFAKLVKGFAIPADETVLFGVTDQTLGGSYGIVATDRALHSRDLMEAPIATPLADIVPEQVRIVEKNLLAGTTHTLPMHLTDANRAALATLVSEYAAGTLH
ncbi:hypothetical protein GRS96_14830 [Rathayibacter sp. VKM Ac-2803]|uniref:hypothetical protein n=1 Tax=Rathayibacter sp. VKM Ac-2803 TaxID=2609256 RepID=UPI00135CE0D3|nr:hypothetical protein [Rathayibacter sp. VKM Ac-2803]MWV50546.1 hypothetical protein [Rathayibacter sp. VKM Ac-2803]